MPIFSYGILGVIKMDFGNLPYAENRKIDEEDLYLEESTTPKETDEFALRWERKRLKKIWGENHEEEIRE